MTDPTPPGRPAVLIPAPIVNLAFPHRWQARILPARPAILPTRHFTYPAQVEEVERGALEILIRPTASTESQPKHLLSAQEFLATCALGFRDPAVPTGLWSTPNPDEICAVSGGYAYLIDSTAPDRFTMLPYRPVLQVHPVPAANLLLFLSHRAILAWGPNGQAWASDPLSDEGITVTAIDDLTLHGRGWRILTDKESPFTLDLRTGLRVP